MPRHRQVLLPALLVVLSGCSAAGGTGNTDSETSTAAAAPATASVASSATPSTTETPPTSVPDGTTLPASMSVEQFAAAIRRPEVITLDVRTPTEYAEGHVTGAKNIDLQAADFSQRIAALDPARSYAIYCRSGKRSDEALRLMQQAGFTSVGDLDGGIIAWQQAGQPVTSG